MKLLATCLACVTCATLPAFGQTPTFGQTPAFGQTGAAPQGELLSAFFGLDDSRRIRIATARICPGIPGGDGMPVIFSAEVDPATLAVEDVVVRRASGAVGRVDCLTLRPADEPGELRTALLIGQFGSDEDPPVAVEIAGDVMSLDGVVSFQGARVEVIPLSAGPTLILAEQVAPTDPSLDAPGGCPENGRATIVRATWAGGVTRPGGGEIGAAETALYRVTLRMADATTAAVAPVAVADLDDNDNNHELCLDVAGTPVRVSFPAGALVDPNDDLNPDTEVAVSGLGAE